MAEVAEPGERVVVVAAVAPRLPVSVVKRRNRGDLWVGGREDVVARPEATVVTVDIRAAVPGGDRVDDARLDGRLDGRAQR